MVDTLHSCLILWGPRLQIPVPRPDRLNPRSFEKISRWEPYTWSPLVPFHILSNQSYMNHRFIWRCKIWDIDGVAKWTTNNTQCVTSGHSLVILVSLLPTTQSHTGARCCFYLPLEFVTAWEIRSLNLLKKCNIVYFLARKLSDKRSLNKASHCEMTHQPTFTRSNTYSHRKLLLISKPSPHAAHCTLHLSSAFFHYELLRPLDVMQADRAVKTRHTQRWRKWRHACQLETLHTCVWGVSETNFWAARTTPT